MSWHEGERATVVGGIVLAAICLFFYHGMLSAFWDFGTLQTSTGLPIAADFANYWSAAKLALAGKATSAYDIKELHEIQQQTFGTHHRYGCGWYYPPTFLLMVLPLGELPYRLAFVVWIGVTLLLFLLVLSRLSHHPMILPLCLLFPGTYMNFLFGQNGFLSGSLLGGGLLLLDRFPLAAGCLLGLLSYKPPLVGLAFLALIFGRYWRSLISAGATCLLLSLISLAVFGYQAWLDYFRVMSLPMQLLADGATSVDVEPTFMAAVLSAGFGIKAAYLVQLVVMLLVVAGVAWVWGKKLALALRGAVLVLGTLLFTPYAFVYDLAILALPLIWLWEDGRVHGRLPGELLLLMFGWLAPLAAPILWQFLRIFQGKLQVAPAVLLALFFLALLKAKAAMNRSGP
jgi:hypothetical protein